ncbi:hypothetical protein HK100_001504 [Physocladia obscura]|uniref:Zn(2)-C6 fungal-type domain-containing protein n=1 Tax=Physocladia obscura TaxID=109957 RepID=A0AAD5XEH1_9FUNG|nr:hypothetical protein HK100_001504 [Physocladia obscura]
MDTHNMQPSLDPIAIEPQKKPKRKKVTQACVFCRRSHMTCDDGRPCQRCIRRKIGHMCTNEPTPAQQKEYHTQHSQIHSQIQSQIQSQFQSQVQSGQTPANNQGAILYANAANFLVNNSGATAQNPGTPHLDLIAATTGASASDSPAQLFAPTLLSQNLSQNLPLTQNYSHMMGNELTIINDFLASLETPATQQLQQQQLMQHPKPQQQQQQPPQQRHRNGQQQHTSLVDRGSSSTPTAIQPQQTEALSSTERFVLTAADPTTIGSGEDRLNQVISAKFEAGLLKPYNYINSYKKLNAWMETHMSPTSRTRILNVMGLFRPRFQWVAQRLTDMDLVLVEEAFERMLLEYDRVFSSMGIPSCLWRRTGEIWKCNKEFAQLVGIPMDQLKEGRLSIYELMSEESAVNYWEKYGNIAFDAGQKAILTSCILKKPDDDGVAAALRTAREGVNCCFSFTIRRDRYSIPIIIAGNFLPTNK